MSLGGRISIPEPKIKIYEDGFEGIDKLGRAADGKKLSDLLERISEPMVIAVDAPWGAGKSVFLKCWVGEHMKPEEVTTQTVYFDAFKHDFMDDPLVGLTGVISERFKGKKGKASKLKVAKQAVSKLAKPAIRIGLAAATAGGAEIAGAVVDAGLKSGSDELAKASEAFWKREDGKRAAMEQFRTALSELAAEQKLVIVVDELDRCRPDYALNLLEVIKHFFDVPNVHFVLGVNLKELANSVRARYGTAVSAERYLQEFVTASMPLLFPSRQQSRASLRYFSNVSKQLGLNQIWKSNYIEAFIPLIDHHVLIGPRDLEKIATLAMLTPHPTAREQASYFLHIGVIILQVLKPDAVLKARLGRLDDETFSSVFNFDSHRQISNHSDELLNVWRLVTWPPSRISNLPARLADAEIELFGDKKPRELLKAVIAETLDTFQTR